MGHSQWSRFILGSRNPCIDRKLKPALVYAIRVPRFAQSSLPKPSEVNPSGFSAPYIICSSSLFYRPRPPTDLPPTLPNTRRRRSSFLSDFFAFVVFGSHLLLQFAGVLEIFRYVISLEQFSSCLGGPPTAQFRAPGHGSSGLHNQFGHRPSATRCASIAY